MPISNYDQTTLDANTAAIDSAASAINGDNGAIAAIVSGASTLQGNFDAAFDALTAYIRGLNGGPSDSQLAAMLLAVDNAAAPLEQALSGLPALRATLATAQAAYAAAVAALNAYGATLV